MNAAQVQARLVAGGCLCAVDGVIGPQTYGAMLAYAAQRQLHELGVTLGRAMALHLAGGGIVSDLGLVHWIAQACHETEGFRYLGELGGPSYFAKYDGRADLGNTAPGDGYRYRGRGIFQLTGRANYRHYGALIAEPLEDQPDLAADPAIAVLIACRYWAEHGLEALAAADDCAAVTRRINGGLNGLAERQAITTRLKRLLGL